MYEHYSISKTKVALCIIAIIGLCVAYDQLFVIRASAQDAATTPSDTSTELLKTVNLIESLKLDTTFLTDEVYSSLEDYTVTIDRDTNPGRPNPFLPISVPRPQTRGR
jgi:hypothetical protein